VYPCVRLRPGVCVCLCVFTKQNRIGKKQKKTAKACQGSNNTICEWTNSGALTQILNPHQEPGLRVCVRDCGQGKNALTRFVQNSLVFWKEKHCKEPKATERRCSAISYMPYAMGIIYVHADMQMYLWVIETRRRQRKRNQNGVGQVIGDRRSEISEIYPQRRCHGGSGGGWQVGSQHNPQIDNADLLIKSFVGLATFLIHPVFGDQQGVLFSKNQCKLLLGEISYVWISLY